MVGGTVVGGRIGVVGAGFAAGVCSKLFQVLRGGSDLPLRQAAYRSAADAKHALPAPFALCLVMFLKKVSGTMFGGGWGQNEPGIAGYILPRGVVCEARGGMVLSPAEPKGLHDTATSMRRMARHRLVKPMVNHRPALGGRAAST